MTEVSTLSCLIYFILGMLTTCAIGIIGEKRRMRGARYVAEIETSTPTTIKFSPPILIHRDQVVSFDSGVLESEK